MGYVDLYRAQVAFHNHHTDSAAQFYESAARKLPWRPDLWEQAGLSMYYTDNDAAIALFEVARAHGALSATGWDKYGEWYWIRSRDKDALRIWSAGLQEYPAHAEFYSEIALAYHGLRNYAAERDALEKWLATDKGRALDHYELGELLMASDPERAAHELLLSSSMDSSFDSAVQTLRTTINLAALEPDESHRLVVIGRGLALVDEWPLAAENFKQASEADPKNAETWAWLGEARQHDGQDGSAELDKALSLDSSNAIVHALRGLYWKRQDNYSKALAEYVLAAQSEPANPAWQASIGDAYTQTGNLVAAFAAYQAAISLAPQDATYRRLLAMFCADNGVQVLDVGLPAAKKAVELAPHDPQSLDALGWSYAQTGLLYNAQQTLLEAIKAAPDSAPAHLHLAETYLRQGNNASALSELKLAQQFDQTGPTGMLASQLLKQYFP